MQMCIPYLFYTCVCVFMFMWHMGLATDSKMSIKFYLLTYLLVWQNIAQMPVIILSVRHWAVWYRLTKREYTVKSLI